jgi:hypothetical protein
MNTNEQEWRQDYAHHMQKANIAERGSSEELHYVNKKIDLLNTRRTDSQQKRQQRRAGLSRLDDSAAIAALRQKLGLAG